MKSLPNTNPLKMHIVKLLKTIAKYEPLAEEDAVLVLLYLNTEEKAIRFVEWILPKIKDGNLTTTAEEILRAATRIHKGDPNLP